MPMIDVYAPSDLFPDGVDREIAEGLTLALLRAEGVQHPAPVQLNNTAAYIHRLTPTAVHTAGTASARTVRIQVLTPPGALNRVGQRASSLMPRRSLRGARGNRRNPRGRGCSSPRRPKGLGHWGHGVRARGVRASRTEIALGGDMFQHVFDAQRAYFATNVTRTYEWGVQQLNRTARLLLVFSLLLLLTSDLISAQTSDENKRIDAVRALLKSIET